MGRGSVPTQGWQSEQHVPSAEVVISGAAHLPQPFTDSGDFPQALIKYSEFPGRGGGVTGKGEVLAAPRGFGQDLPSLRLDPRQTQWRGQLCLFLPRQ